MAADALWWWLEVMQCVVAGWMVKMAAVCQSVGSSSQI